MQSLNTIHTSFPKSLSPYAPAFLSHSLTHLHTLLPVFVNHYVRSDAALAPTSSNDDPDQQVSLTNLASSLLDYVGSAARTSAGRLWFEGTEGPLQSYIEMVAGWAQMTEEDVSSLSVWLAVIYELYSYRRRTGPTTPMLLWPKKMTRQNFLACGLLDLTWSWCVRIIMALHNSVPNSTCSTSLTVSRCRPYKRCKLLLTAPFNKCRTLIDPMSGECIVLIFLYTLTQRSQVEAT
jgi:hypothetical protein